jgi:hypothetical protein
MPRISDRKHLADDLGVPDVGAKNVTVLDAPDGNAQRGRLELAELSAEPIRVELKFVPTEFGLRLAWSLAVYPHGDAAFEALIDAVDGSDLARIDYSAHAGPQYRVFPIRKRSDPSFLACESPAHGPQADVTGASDPLASPSEWLNTAFCGQGVAYTFGNNVDAYETVNGSPYRPQGDIACHFLFETLDMAYLSQSLNLADYRDAAITNLFYTVNVCHDIFYQYGFNEAAGNMQLDNLGRGGIGGDRVNASRAGELNNGFFVWAPEGTSPPLSMGFGTVRSILETDHTAPAGANKAVSMAAGDFNFDSKMDLVTANEDSSNITVFTGNGAGGFTQKQNYALPAGAGPKAVTTANVNGDPGGLDIAVANGAGNSVSVFLNSSGGFPNPPTTLSLSPYGISQPRAIASLDLAGDGDPDLAVANFGSSDLALINTVYGYYFVFHTKYSLPGKGVAVVAFDVNSDSYRDLVVASQDSDAVQVFVGTALGSLSPASPVSLGASDDPESLSFADFDADGKLDLAVACKGSNTVALLRNTGTYGYFAEIRRVHVGSQPVAVTATEVTTSGSFAPLNLNLNEPGNGTVFNDASGQGVASQTVFLDYNQNGVLDTGEFTTVTGPTGAYEFSSPAVKLYPCTYTVALVVPSGWKQVRPSDPLGVLVSRWNECLMNTGTGLCDPGDHNQCQDTSDGCGARGYADVWGDGDFVYLGHDIDVGVDIVDLRDPARPRLAARWSNAGGCNEIEDIEVHGGIGFFASDNGGGVYIVDVTDPFAPTRITQLKEFPGGGCSGGGFNNVHTLTVDNNFLYLTNLLDRRVRIYDVANPNSPVFVLDVTTGTSSSDRVHQVTVQNGRMYVCAPVSGYTQVFDVSNVQGGVVSSLCTLQTGLDTHSSWPSANGSHLFVAREPSVPTQSGNEVDVWDLTGLPGNCPTNRVTKISLPISESTCAHNPMVDGNLLYVAWYEAGLLVYDITVPASPVLLKRYDWWTAPIAIREGNWGVYPFLGPDRILASDTITGLYVFSNKKTHTVTIDPKNGILVVEGKDFGIVPSP